MVTHAEAVVAPDDGGTACGATGGNTGATFAGFVVFDASARGEPIEVRGGGGEGAKGGEEWVLGEACRDVLAS